VREGVGPPETELLEARVDGHLGHGQGCEEGVLGQGRLDTQAL